MAEFRIEDSSQPSSVPAWFGQWSSVSAERDLAFVLPTESLHASALVLLGAMVSSRRQRGLENRVAGDEQDNPLARHLIKTGSVAVRNAGPSGALELVRAIPDRRTARQVAEEVAEAMTELAPAVSPSTLRMARFVFEELGCNVFDHSGRPDTGYGSVKVDAARRRLELAFADCGVGFRASLQRNPELEGRVSDDAEALQLALYPRITGTSTPRTIMGIGLKTLTVFSDWLGGDLWLASSTALLQRRTTAGQRINVMRTIPAWQGSWLCLDAPIT